MHGGSSDRKGSVAHAEMLARHGYGVLLYDARGRGESDGSENNYGWDWAKDVDGALDFLTASPTSTRADRRARALDRRGRPARGRRRETAASPPSWRTAPPPARSQDWQRLRGTELGTVPGWMMFSTIRVLSGDPPGPPLEEAVARIDSPTLLVSAGTAEEREFNVRYDGVAAGPVEHWNLPDATHTHGLREQPEAYERRVVGLPQRGAAMTPASASFARR